MESAKKNTSIIRFAVMRQLFFTLIYTFLTYGIETWGHSSVTQLNRLGSKINESVKISGREPVQKESYIKLNSMPLCNVCQHFTLNTQEVRHS